MVFKQTVEEEVQFYILTAKLCNLGLNYVVEPVTGYETRNTYVFPRRRILKSDLLKPLSKKTGLSKSSLIVVCFKEDLELAYEVAHSALQIQVLSMQRQINRLEEKLMEFGLN